MASFDTVIAGGLLVDGQNFPARRADVGIVNGRIADIGKLRAHDAKRVVDASGHIVAPGFIDTHTHYDAQLFWDPYLTLSGWQGVTSVVIGNCGFGFAPAREGDQDYLMRSLTRVEAIPYECIKTTMPWDWESFPEWLDSIDRAKKGINILASVPLNPLMTYAMGREASKSREPTPAELAKMCQLLVEAMDAGACGWSAQMLKPGSGKDNHRDFDGTPFATDLMSDETMLAFGHVLADYGRGFIQTSASDADWSDLTQRLEALALAADRPVLLNAIASLAADPTQHIRASDWIRSCQQRGIPMWANTFVCESPFIFTFEHWNLFDDRPAWNDATLGTPEERLAKFRDPEVRRRIKEDDGGRRHYEYLTILSTRSERFLPVKGTRLSDAARILGYDDVVDLLFDLVVEDELKTLFQSSSTNLDMKYRAEIAQIPYGVWGVSDGGAHTKFLTTGAYGTDSIIEFTKKHSIVTLEEAHWRMSALPAQCIGLKDRGTLTVGAAADILVYDYEKLALLDEEVVYDLPGGEWRRIRRAEGYQEIMVNGVPIYDGNEFSGEHPGQLLRQ